MKPAIHRPKVMSFSFRFLKYKWRLKFVLVFHTFDKWHA